MRMRSIKSLSEQINTVSGIKTEIISTSDGAIVSIDTISTDENIDNIRVSMKIDAEVDGIKYSSIINQHNIDRLNHLKFDTVNAQTVKRFLEGHEIDFMHNVNASEIHTFIPA